MRPLRTPLWLGACALVLAACGDEAARPGAAPPPVPAPAPPKAARPTLATLEAPEGPVTLEREGARRPAVPEPLVAKDAIETGPEGTATLRVGQDRVIELGAEGRFELDGDAAGVTLSVLRGLVLTRVPARAEGTPPPGDPAVRLTITTPFGLLRVGAASLSMDVGPEGATVDVQVGELELVGRSGDVSRVVAGGRGTLGTPRELPLITMNLSLSGGRAEVKASGAKGFVAVNPKKVPALASGDTVRVKAGTVGLESDGSQVRLALHAGAVATLGEARQGAGREERGLELKKGELEVSAPQGQVTRLALGGGAALSSAEGGQFAVRQGAGGLEVEALAGDVSLELPGQPAVLVPAGSAATAPAAGPARVRALPPEVLELPARAGARVFHTGLKRVSLGWTPVEGGGDYRVEVATDAAFEHVVRSGLVHQPFVTMPAPAKGRWFWRAWRGDTPLATGNVSFAPEPRAQDLSRIKNVVADGAETTTIFFQDKPPVVTFTWAAEEGAARYTVKVYREGQLASAVAERTVAERSAALPENTLVEGRYLWSVTPLDAKGTELRGGRMNKLLMVYDNAVPSLVVKTPRNGDPGGSTVRATGVAPFGSRLFINGKAIALDEKARFDAAVAPFPGGRLVFRLLHGGAETYTLRIVRSR